jgi:hypothetical protein
MSIAVEQPTLTIHMEADCLADDCDDFASRTWTQLSSGAYTWPCSVMPLPASIEEWEAEHRTARKRAWAAERSGYTFAEICREHHEDDIFEINTSKHERQGRPMSPGYLQRQTFSPLPEYPCSRHAIRTYGVLDDGGTLRAYATIYRVGELVMVSQILGHADYLHRGIMFLLVRDTLAAQIEAGDGVVFYNRHDSGEDGLVWFKERLGFMAARVEWSL